MLLLWPALVISICKYDCILHCVCVFLLKLHIARIFNWYVVMVKTSWCFFYIVICSTSTLGSALYACKIWCCLLLNTCTSLYLFRKLPLDNRLCSTQVAYIKIRFDAVHALTAVSNIVHILPVVKLTLHVSNVQNEIIIFRPLTLVCSVDIPDQACFSVKASVIQLYKRVDIYSCPESFTNKLQCCCYSQQRALCLVFILATSRMSEQ